MSASPRLVVAHSTPSKSTAKAGRLIESCPLARLAEEAAAVLRAMKALGHDELQDAPDVVERSELPAWKAIVAQADGPTPEYVVRSLYKRAEAVRDLAVHQRATSVKGALFQIYLAGGKATGIGGSIRAEQLRPDDKRAIEDIEEQCEHLLNSAAAALELQMVGDPDLHILRRWYFDPRFHAATVVEEAVAFTRNIAA